VWLCRSKCNCVELSVAKEVEVEVLHCALTNVFLCSMKAAVDLSPPATFCFPV
jgi:hypothetical protein